jgi:hypothetical protein
MKTKMKIRFVIINYVWKFKDLTSLITFLFWPRGPVFTGITVLLLLIAGVERILQERDTSWFCESVH